MYHYRVQFKLESHSILFRILEVFQLLMRLHIMTKYTVIFEKVHFFSNICSCATCLKGSSSRPESKGVLTMVD